MTRLGAPWLSAPGPQALCAALEAAGHRALFVGGCVRNTLLGVPVSDLDLATDALPETVSDRAENAGFKAVPTGIDHGTVTVIAGKEPIEVTTFRHDVETDGRRATIAFASDVAEDAARRDFTMNALYVDARGTPQDLTILSDARDADPRMRELTLRAILDAQIPPIPPDLMPTLDDGRVKIEYEAIVY